MTAQLSLHQKLLSLLQCVPLDYDIFFFFFLRIAVVYYDLTSIPICNFHVLNTALTIGSLSWSQSFSWFLHKWSVFITNFSLSFSFYLTSSLSNVNTLPFRKTLVARPSPVLTFHNTIWFSPWKIHRLTRPSCRRYYLIPSAKHTRILHVHGNEKTSITVLRLCCTHQCNDRCSLSNIHSAGRMYIDSSEWKILKSFENSK